MYWTDHKSLLLQLSGLLYLVSPFTRFLSQVFLQLNSSLISSDSCYVFFIGPKSNLYYSKYIINSGDIQVSPVLTNLEFAPTWDGIGGSNQGQIFLYLKNESHQLIQVQFDTKTDTAIASDSLFVIIFYAPLK